MAVTAIDTMGFAGGFACGVKQAGIELVAKREPSAFDGFGVESWQKNFPDVPDVQVTEPEFWRAVRADVVFGCPPCSGFSMLSTVNTADSKTGKVVDGVRVAQRGVDSPDNKWMFELVSYAAKVKPEVAVFECVQAGGKLGAPLMRQLWQRLRDESGLDYHMTDVFMNAALVGGDVIRPRYFFVAHLAPFGVDLPKGSPRPLMDLIRDLPEEEDFDSGYDWAHVTNGGRSAERTAVTIRAMRERGDDWLQGTRLPENLSRFVDAGGEIPSCWYKPDGTLLSHAYSDNMYAPFRWRAEKPMGVVTGGFMDRAVHPLYPRHFTYREGARFMGLPDDWSLSPIAERHRGPWLGKAIPVSSGRWIATWAAASIEEAPGEYAGVLVEDRHRVVDVTTRAKVDAVERGLGDAPAWWPVVPGRRTYAMTVSRDVTNAQRGVEAAPRPVATARNEVEAVASARPYTPSRVARTHRGPQRWRSDGPSAERVDPEAMVALVARYGLSRRQVAEAMGVSQSRVTELTTRARPKSWLKADLLPRVEAALNEYLSEARET